jgi:hypothetical protein
MGIDVRPSIVIRRPRAEVAAVMFDPRNDSRWTTGVVDCRPLSEGRLRAGSRVERTTRFLGRRFSYLYETTAADNDVSVDLKVDQPFPMRIRYELQDAADGTLTSIRARGDASGFFRLAEPLLARMVARNIGKDLEKLKALVEATQSPQAVR